MKTKITVVCLIFLLILLTACQPTPEKEVVVGKGEEGVNEMYELAGVEQKDGEPKEVDVDISYSTMSNKTYEVPKTYKNHLERGNCIMDIDAEVIIPEYALPIVEVQLEKINFELIDEFISMTTADSDLYPIEVINIIETKEIIQYQIDRAIRDLAYYNRPYEEIYNPKDPITQENVEALKKNVEERITELSKKLETAPENFEDALNLLREKGEFEISEGRKIYPTMLEPKAITQTNFKDIPYYLGAIDADFNSTYYYIDATSKYNQQIHFQARHIDYINIPFGNATEKEALSFAQSYVELLGQGLKVVGVEEDEYKYTFSFMRDYCGVTNALMFESPGCVSRIGSTEMPYKQEKLVIQVSKKDPMFIKSVEYYSPLSVKNVVIRDANLLSFDEITKKFEQYITTHTFGVENELEIFIDRIQLEVMRIRKPNAEGEFLIVPVWNFYGTEKNTWKGEDKTSENQGEYQTYLTINAIDGSIIDMHKQY